jgi:acyl-CoA thioester hydrolase
MADVDAYGVMYYSRFFEVFERARTELFRSVGIEYRQISQQRQILMPVVEAACRYLAPAVYDDLLTVETAITGIGTRGMRFDYRIFRDDLPLAVGFTQHIFVDIQGRPVSFGKEIFQTLKDKGLIQGEFKDPEEEKEVSEEVLLSAINAAHKAIKQLIELQKEFAEQLEEESRLNALILENLAKVEIGDL